MSEHGLTYTLAARDEASAVFQRVREAAAKSAAHLAVLRRAAEAATEPNEENR